MLHSLLLVAALLAVGDGPRISTPSKSAQPAAVEAFADPGERFIGPNLPCFTKQLSDNDYKWWVMAQNEIAYEAAGFRATQAARSPGILVTEETTVGQSSGRFRGYNNLRIREVQTIAPGAAPFGGGPVWIHNPFVRQ